MKTIVAVVVAMLLFKGVSYGKEVLVLPKLDPSYSPLLRSGEYCLRGVSYFVFFGRSPNLTIERDRNDKPIPCITQKRIKN